MKYDKDGYRIDNSTREDMYLKVLHYVSLVLFFGLLKVPYKCVPGEACKLDRTNRVEMTMGLLFFEIFWLPIQIPFALLLALFIASIGSGMKPRPELSNHSDSTILVSPTNKAESPIRHHF